MGKIIKFNPKDYRSDAQKYAEALEDQTGRRSDLGLIPCPYCEDVSCNFDCEESQKHGYPEEEY